MDPFDFDKLIDRKGTNSLKWDGVDRLLHKSSEGMWDGLEINSKPDILPLWAADMDFSAPPKVIEDLKNRVEHGIMGYAIRPDSYNQAIVDWLRTQHQWEVDPTWLLYSPGVLPAVNLSVASFSQKSDKVVLQPPVYYRFYQAIHNNERIVVENPLLEQGGVYSMDFENLEEKFKQGAKMLLLCSRHNPVTKVWSRETLKILGDLCRKYGVVIISDEIHSDLVYPKYKHVPLAAISPEIADITITCIAPSKTFNLAGLRTACLIIPNQDLRGKMQNTIAKFGLDVSNVFGMLALESAYRNGSDWLKALLSYLQNNVQLIRDFQSTSLAKMKIIEPEATHMVWLDFRDFEIPHAELKNLLLKKAGVGMSDGYTYFGKEGAGFQRINIACPKSVLQEALDRITKVL